MQEQAMPPSAAIFGMVTSVWAAQAAATAARLGVPDELAHGAKTASEVALRLGVREDPLYRVMRALVATGVLTATPDGRFGLTPVGECLRSDVPGSMRSFLIAETAPGHWLPWGHLEHSMRTGEPAAPKVLGTSAWSYYETHPEEQRHFAEAMSGISALACQAVVGSYSFDGAKTIVDVGGSHGAFLAAALAQVPDAKGILYDLPHVVADATDSLASAGVASRVERVAGDFFASVPKGGDTYLLKHILHDWNDAECVRILGNVRDAMSASGRIVVVEMPITSEGPPSPAPLLDLNMLVMLTGRERTVDEYGALFARAGLRLDRFVPTASPFAVLEARRA